LPDDAIAPKKKTKRGPVPKQKPPPPKSTAKPPPPATKAQELSVKKPARKRVNWGKGEAKEKMETAVTCY